MFTTNFFLGGTVTSQPMPVSTVPTSPPAGAEGPPIGAIVGGIVAVLLVVALVVVLVVVILCFLLKRKKNKTYNTKRLQTVVLEDKHKDSTYYNATPGTADTPLDGGEAPTYTEIDGAEHAYSTVDEPKNGSVSQPKPTKPRSYEQLDEGGRNRKNTYTSVDKNGKPVSYENVQDSEQEDLANMYAIPDKKPSTARKPPSISSKPSSRGSSAGPTELPNLDVMYAVPEKKPSYVNKPGSREGSSGPNEYADIADPRPTIPKKRNTSRHNRYQTSLMLTISMMTLKLSRSRRLVPCRL